MNLLVNIDHVATLRNARGEGYPSPSEAAIACEEAGAAGIVFHLRGDRRHIMDHDVAELRQTIKGTIDFEMAATEEMIAILLKTKPHLCTLVPEGREELTTEGGLNMKHVYVDFESRVFPAIKPTGIEISLFVDPHEEDIRLSAQLGAHAIELHTGTYANATSGKARETELKKLVAAAELAHSLGMKVNAGHGLNLENTSEFVNAIPFLNDVSIGHALVSQSLFWGFDKTVKEYLKIMGISK